MRIALGQFAAARKRRAAAHRNMRVLAHEQRFEAAGLELTRELIDGDAVLRGKVKDANAHGGSRHLARRTRGGADQPITRVRVRCHDPRGLSVASHYATASGGAADARKASPLSFSLRGRQ